ncbi:hypothetical protein EO92_04265 [Methanosarcina sp. 2.H.A.1B.4]|nr:hypothetical protein EO92_04265 [Methanosarcina sp. 2.H.A.1B.4]
MIRAKNPQVISFYQLDEKYLINSTAFAPISLLSDKQLYLELTTGLFHRLGNNYYLQHLQEYKEHRPYILRISDLVSSRPAETLTANERAFELFGDEKALTSPEHAAFDGNAVLKNLELTLEDIGAEIVYEPFVYTRSKMFDTRDITPVRTILIVENKDTYWTLKNAVLHSDLDYIDMVIYGEGKAILSTFRYIEEVGGRVNDRYFYFGDLDREGIEIFNLFRKKYSEYEIVPAVKYYEYMINKVGVENAKAIRTHQKVKDYSSFIGYFSDTTGHNIKTIVENNLYIPQEAINKTDIKELRVIGLQ